MLQDTQDRTVRCRVPLERLELTACQCVTARMVLPAPQWMGPVCAEKDGKGQTVPFPVQVVLGV